MTLLIATDEAGYGPKLGPLVIAATAWELPGSAGEVESWEDTFAGLRQPVQCGETEVVVDDSKVVFSRKTGLGPLHAAFSACLHWCDIEANRLAVAIEQIAPDSVDSISQTPWLAMPDVVILPATATVPVVQAWGSSGVKLLGIRLSVVTASEFNQSMERGYNKADLLSESTLDLVRSLAERHGHAGGDMSNKTHVFCDRHGGRRYYAAVLQNAFPDCRISVIGESKSESRYRLETDQTELIVRFSVKGDSFAPVALSSMIAKYVRERSMQALHRFFSDRYRGEQPLRETAGYPVDADRYLGDIAAVIEREGIPLSRLVRSR